MRSNIESKIGHLLLALAVIWIASWFVQPAKAQMLDGNFLYNQCQQQSGLETAYVAGAIDAIMSSEADLFELPPNSILKQYRDVVCLGLAMHPDWRTYDASVLVHAFIAKAFPKPN